MLCLLLVITLSFEVVKTDIYEEILYEHLLLPYNPVVLPVAEPGQNVTVRFGAKLIRIIGVDEKNQVLTTNLWLELEWTDTGLTWPPERYGDITKLNMPSSKIWIPDIVLYNNAAGDPEITIFNDAIVYFDGTVNWQPPAIYKSFCEINVLYFPYDEQNCFMKFGMWSYTGVYVDMWFLQGSKYVEFFDVNTGFPAQFMEKGMDLSYYYESGSWDLQNITAERHIAIYECCGDTVYVDFTFWITLRRKPLFYTAMLIVPCTLISFLTLFVFYIPANSNTKVSFSISIFVSMAFFMLLLVDLIPPTSRVIPLFGKYLLFTMFLVSMACIISVVVLNFHHRSGANHGLNNTMRFLFLDLFPRILRMEKPYIEKREEILMERKTKRMALELLEKEKALTCKVTKDLYEGRQFSPCIDGSEETLEQREWRLFTQLQLRVLKHIKYIQSHYKEIEEVDEVSADWTFVALVIDRIFLIIYVLVFFIGTASMFLSPPTLYDNAKPLSIPEKHYPVIGDTIDSVLNS